MSNENPSFHGSFITMDGCLPCERLKVELKENDSLDEMNEINVSHIREEAARYNVTEKQLKNFLDYHEISICPSVIIFKRENASFKYIGKIEGFLKKEDFKKGLDVLKKYDGELNIVIKSKLETKDRGVISKIIR